VVVRSHELPEKLRGHQLLHTDRVCTVFSASNYCGEAMNSGGVIVWDSTSFPNFAREDRDVPESGTLREHWALPFDDVLDLMQRHDKADQSVKTFVAARQEMISRADRAQFISSTPAVIEDKIVEYLKMMFVIRKADLWRAFSAADSSRTFTVTKQQWAETCSEVLGEQFPWAHLRRSFLSEAEAVDDRVQYAKWLSRFTIRYDNADRAYVGWQRKVLISIFSHFLKQDLSMTAALRLFDRSGTGYVTALEFQQALHDVGAAITHSQACSLLRTLSNLQSSKGIAIAEFLSLFTTAFSSQRMVCKDRDGLDWCASCLEWIGDFVRRRTGMQTLLDFFRSADTDHNGYLETDEFIAALSCVLTADSLEAQIRTARGERLTAVAEEIADEREWANADGDAQHRLRERLTQLASFLDVNGTGRISLLEFMSGFAPRCEIEMRMDILEQISVTIFQHRQAIAMALKRFDRNQTGLVSSSQLQQVLLKLNHALSCEAGSPLTDLQISELVLSLGSEDHGQVRYREFLASFEFVDANELAGKPEFLTVGTANF